MGGDVTPDTAYWLGAVWGVAMAASAWGWVVLDRARERRRTNHGPHHCSRCGSLMTRETGIGSFDRATGEGKSGAWWRCPNARAEARPYFGSNVECLR